MRVNIKAARNSVMSENVRYKSGFRCQLVGITLHSVGDSGNYMDYQSKMQSPILSTPSCAVPLRQMRRSPLCALQLCRQVALRVVTVMADEFEFEIA